MEILKAILLLITSIGLFTVSFLFFRALLPLNIKRIKPKTEEERIIELEKLRERRLVALCKADDNFNNISGPGYHNEPDHLMAIKSIESSYKKAVQRLHRLT